MNFINKTNFSIFFKSPKIHLYFFGFSILTIILYLSLFYTNGQLITYIHDGLDSNIATYKMLADSGYFFASNDTIVPNMMGGMPRSIFFSEFRIVSLLYYFFEADNAYIINELLIRLIAFTGTTLLLKKYVFHSNNLNKNEIDVNSNIIILISLSFSLLPYWSLGGASVSAQPFVLYAFLNLKGSTVNKWNWIVFLIYPLYSSLVLSGMFFLFLLTIVWIVDCFKNKKINILMFSALLLMSLLYLAVEYRLVLNFINPQFVSNRVEFVSTFLNISDSFSKSLKMFFEGQYHAYPLHAKYMLPTILFLGLILIFKGLFLSLGIFILILMQFFSTELNQVLYLAIILLAVGIFIYKKEFILSTIMITILLISLIAGFEDSTLLKPLKETFSLFEQISFDRFYFLLPLLWMLAFSFSIKIILKYQSKWSILIIFILVLQVIYSFQMQNNHISRKPVSFDKFYSQTTYEEIKNYIGEPVETYRVMSIGLHPSAAIYNGFYTVDGYIAYYPLKNKHEFRKIIALELEKDQKLKKAFDDISGRRCRLMSRKRELVLNLEAFKNLGGRFIFSAYPIKINNNDETKLLNTFLRVDKRNKIFLYQVL